MIDIDEETLNERIGLGLMGLLGLIIALFMFGTSIGRAMILAVIIIAVIVYGLGWLIDVGIEVYEEYTE